ncbi:MAG TPA: S8 family serine peptidase [Pyrinomonadaceae bacterium]
MKYSQQSLAIKRLAFPLLLIALLVNQLPAAHAVAAAAAAPRTNVRETAGGERGSKVSSDLLDVADSKRKQNERVKVIVQLNEKSGVAFDLFLQLSGARTTRKFSKLNARAVELPVRTIKALTARDDLLYVSPDQATIPAGHVSETTGTDAARDRIGISTSALDGTGIGIAVLDSGLDLEHRSFLNRRNNSRVVLSRDFTGEGRTDDPFGHGTHVASAAAGNGRISGAEYIGIAPNANIINLRVLNSRGQGTTSGLLAALDWVLVNRALYNIRVVNLSLGAPAIESYRNDPVCRAVRRLVDAGVVVAAAAGNNGRNSSGQKIYGQIHSPGNEPSALTVGASNSYGTDARADDTVTTYSSRGPTRSSWTDALGVKRYDSLIKPDVVAPGNRMIFAESDYNHLVRQNPELDASVSTVDNRRMMYMSGSSMATPVAAGAAALLLQANPRLTPNLVKMILMYTAQPLSGFNMLEQGAGQINVEGATRLAKLVRTDLSALTPVGAPLLTTAALPAPYDEIAGGRADWSQGIILNRTYATGPALIERYQKVYSAGALLGDAVVETMNDQFVDTSKMFGAVVLGENILTSLGGASLAEGTIFLDTDLLLGDGIVIGDGIVVGDGIIVGDGIVIGDGIVVGDSRLRAQSVRVSGDDTPAMR